MTGKFLYIKNIILAAKILRIIRFKFVNHHSLNFRFFLSTLARTNSIKVVNDLDDILTFHQFHDDLIKNELRLSPTLKTSANQYLLSVKKLWFTQRLLNKIQQYKELANIKNYKQYKETLWRHMSDNNVIFVSIHIHQIENPKRMFENVHARMPSKQFIEDAMNWFRKMVNCYFISHSTIKIHDLFI